MLLLIRKRPSNEKYETLKKQIADANQRNEVIKSERVQQLPSVIAGEKKRYNELVAEFKELDDQSEDPDK